MISDNWFLAAFSKSNYIEKSKAKVFFFYSLFMFAALTMLILLYFIMPLPPSVAKKGFIGATLIIVLVAASLVMMRTGKFAVAVWTYALPTILAVVGLRIRNSPAFPETAFSTYIFYMPYLIVYVAVFAKRWQAILTTLFFFVTNWLIWFMVKDTGGDIGTGIHTGVVNSSLGILTTGFVAVALISIVEKYTQLMKTEADASAEKLERIKTAMGIAHDGIHVGTSLVAESAAMQDEANKIEHQIEGIRAEMKVLRNDAELTATANDSIVKSTENMGRTSEGYQTMTVQASSAVEEMTASIDNISTISSKNRDSVERLATSISAGIETAELSAETIASLSQSSESLQEVVAVISAISSQTNLLAMNAAIEAAHAGDSGKGFAVVADEIRRLAEETSVNSKTIADGLATFFGKITKAEQANQHIGEAFQAIGTEITQTRMAFDEIQAGMKELSIGTGEINSSVSNVVTSSRDMSESIRNITAMISQNTGSIKSLREKSGSALTRLDVITGSFTDILSRAGNVRTLGQKSEEVIRDLDESIRAI